MNLKHLPILATMKKIYSIPAKTSTSSLKELVLWTSVHLFVNLSSDNEPIYNIFMRQWY